MHKEAPWIAIALLERLLIKANELFGLKEPMLPSKTGKNPFFH